MTVAFLALMSLPTLQAAAAAEQVLSVELVLI
jgi:hypothetical protein